jgi:putative membrane protein
MILRQHWGLISFNLLYVLVFAGYYLSIKNYEFLWYVAILLFFLILILATLKRTDFDRVILWGLSLWGLLHMAGGGVRVGDGVLYKFIVVDLVGSGESQILKFDQVVHFFGFGVATIVFYHLLRSYLAQSQTVNWTVLYPLIVLGGMGLGALNEIIEFIAVVIFGQTGVGGYWNTALDLVFNLLGAIGGVIFIHFYYRRRPNRTLS